MYPARYADGRRSSHQQQASCYTYKDINNWRIIKRPNNEDLAVEELYDSIKHEDIIHLFKKGTRCSTRDIFSTLLFNHQRLYKAYRAIALFSHKIPDKIFYEEFSLSVSSIQIPHNAVEPLNGPDAAHLLADIELGSKSNKFTEFQFKMLITNQKNAQNYNSAGDPAEWPFLTRGIAYYITKDSSNRVQLMGNILVWHTASLCLLLYSCLLVFYLLRGQRLCHDIDKAEIQIFCTTGEGLLTGYLPHFLPCSLKRPSAMFMTIGLSFFDDNHEDVDNGDDTQRTIQMPMTEASAVRFNTTTSSNRINLSMTHAEDVETLSFFTNIICFTAMVVEAPRHIGALYASHTKRHILPWCSDIPPRSLKRPSDMFMFMFMIMFMSSFHGSNNDKTFCDKLPQLAAPQGPALRLGLYPGPGNWAENDERLSADHYSRVSRYSIAKPSPLATLLEDSAPTPGLTCSDYVNGGKNPFEIDDICLLVKINEFYLCKAPKVHDQFCSVLTTNRDKFHKKSIHCSPLILIPRKRSATPSELDIGGRETCPPNVPPTCSPDVHSDRPPASPAISLVLSTQVSSKEPNRKTTTSPQLKPRYSHNVNKQNIEPQTPVSAEHCKLRRSKRLTQQKLNHASSFYYFPKALNFPELESHDNEAPLSRTEIPDSSSPVCIMSQTYENDMSPVSSLTPSAHYIRLPMQL